MLGLLAADKTAEFHEFVAEHPPLVEHLIGYGLIRNDDGRYGFVFDAVRQVVQRGVKEASAPSLEEMRAEISRRRSRLEEGARSVLFFWARRLDQGEWEVACATCIPKLIAKQGPMTPQQVFSKGNSPLFVLDLLEFAKVSGICGSDPTKVSDIARAFDIVNRYRVDAHAKSITKAEFGAWRSAMERLEELFIPPD
jgi:hypothetical protein